MEEYSYEKIGGGITVAVSGEHTFGTDSFLLSYFAIPKRKDKVVDLGTGCGIIPLLWYRTPETTPAKVWAVDIQPKAIEQVKLSAELSQVSTLVPIVADLKAIKEYIPSGSVDLVTCNPPYKAEGSGIVSTSASDQIARHETLCTINDVCIAAKWLLRFGGRLCVCQLTERLPDVIEAMRANGIEPKRMRFAHNTSSSAPWLVLVEGKLGAKPFLTVEAPLYLRENGATSAEMTQVYGMYGKVEL